MGIKIIVKVVFNSSKDELESFGNNRYLLKLSYPEDSGAKMIIIEYLSRKMGTPASRIAYMGQDMRKNWIFEVL
jgi:uncharacterized protein YggU (UPF0235/DUF167 family)